MEGSLLKRENEFYKLNEQLEIKAQKLLEEVKNVMRVSNTTTVTVTGRDPPIAKVISSENILQKEDEPSIHKDCKGQKKQVFKRNNFDLVAKLHSLPEAARAIRPEAALHVLKVKSQLLEQELATIEVELKNKTDLLKKNKERFLQLQEERQKWQQQSENIQQLYKKQSNRLHELNSHLQITDTENTSLLKDVEELRKKFKQSSQSSIANKAKLNRSLDENKKLKSSLVRLESEEKKLVEMSRRETENSEAKIQSLEKQKRELILGIKKQWELIENLKSQSMHLEVSQNLQLAEEEITGLIHV